jgi:ABC-type phosphate transport system permease subunit
VSVIGVDQASARGLERPRAISRGRTQTDRAYRGIATAAGLLTLVILVLIGVFLLIRSLPAFRQMGWAFFTTSVWQPDGTTHQFGILAVLYWTFVIAIVALVIAMPISIACALFINEYASRRLRRPLTAVIDLLAAIPSVIYGIWGLDLPAATPRRRFRVAEHQPRFHPHLQDPRCQLRGVGIHRRDRCRAHGHADLHLGHA